MADKNALVTVTERQLETAKLKGQVVGFAEGVGVTLLVGLVLRFLGWIPLVVVAGAVGWVAYKLLFGRKGKDEGEG